MTESDHKAADNQQEPDLEPLVQYEDLEQATGFTQVSNAVLRCYPELSDGEKMTYIALKSFAYVSPETFVGQETLSRARNITVSTVSRHLTRLIEVGLVRVRRRGQGKTNIWIITRIPREKLEQYLNDWRPNLTLTPKAQTKTCDSAQIKNPHNTQAMTAQDPQAEEQESEEHETKKERRRSRPDGASLSLSTHTTTAGSSERIEAYTRAAGIVENSEDGGEKFSTVGDSVEKLAGEVARRFGVPEQERSIRGFLKQYDAWVVQRALDSVAARLDEGERIEKPIAYLYSVVKVIQAERDAMVAEREADEAERATIARNWARHLQREWEDEHVRGILLDTYRSQEFVDAIMDEIGRDSGRSSKGAGDADSAGGATAAEEADDTRGAGGAEEPESAESEEEGQG